jgi:hypothetical protein
MSKEKKPRNPVSAKKRPARKTELESAVKPEVDAVLMKAAPVVPASPPLVKERAKTKARPAAKSLRVSLHEVIRLRAYEIYLQRGGTQGNPHEDWAIAEREVRAHFGQDVIGQDVVDQNADA